MLHVHFSELLIYCEVSYFTTVTKQKISRYYKSGKQSADEGFRIKERNLHIYTSSFQGINESVEPD